MSANSEETIPQIALFIQESSVRPPPPPPQAASSSVPRISVQAPRSMNVALQHLPPPPPPPPPAVPTSTTSQRHNPVYHGPCPQPSTSSAISHPPTAIPMFDATRPPPPIHTHVQLNNNTSRRPISTSCTGGPCKLRKTEEAKPDDAMCDVCVQREISIKNYKIKMEKISSEDECQTLLFNKKLNAYRRQKDFLRSLVDSDIFRMIEEFVEDVPQNNFHSVLNDLNDSYPKKLTSSIPKHMLLQFMDYFLSDSSKFESSQSVRAEDSLQQTLSTMSRSPVNRSPPDILQTLQDMLYSEDRSSSSERPGYGELTVDRAHRPSTNGVSSYRQFSNGQHVAQPPPAPAPAPALASAPVAPPAPPPALIYPHHPPPRAYYPPPYPLEPRATTSQAPVSLRPPHAEPYPSPYYYYQ